MDLSPAIADATQVADPAEGLRAVRALRELADRLEFLHVSRARELGWSWQDIARSLGISRQAAHHKYARATGPTGGPTHRKPQ